MELSERYRDIIAEELTIIGRQMNDEPDILRKLFYFSGSYGLMQRVFNLEYHSEVVLMFTILHEAYKLINTNITNTVKGQEAVIQVPVTLLDKLANQTIKLGEAIKNDTDIISVLSSISAIGFVSTGNGYYLYKIGKLEY